MKAIRARMLAHLVVTAKVCRACLDLAGISVEEPVPDDALVGHLRKRLNQLINAELGYSFGQ